ncbi:MAG: glycosyltransferase 87 family protein [Alphaproteobacteria bacterium]|nr:glycosyltransferase 87 family protein [Alphaproteobacteria bacterium]
MSDRSNTDHTNYFLPWIDHIIENGGFSALADDFSLYAPPILYLFVIVSGLHEFLDKVIVLKLIPIFFNFVASFFVYKIVRFYWRSFALSLLAAAGFLLLPTVVMNSAYWGQMDVIYTAFLLAFFYCTLIGRPTLAVIVFGLALSIKLQAVFIAPYILFLVFRREIQWFHLALVPLVYIVMMLPAAVAGRPMLELLTVYFTQFGFESRLSMNAPNIYHFVQRLTPINYQAGVMVGLCVSFVAGLAISVSAFRIGTVSKELKLLLLVITVVLMPYVLPKMHDRYFFPADVFAYLLMFVVPRLWPIAVALQLSSLLAYSKFLFGFSYGPYLGGGINTLVIAGLALYLLHFHFSADAIGRSEPEPP